MSWASRRRTVYAGGVVLFFAVVVGVPLAFFLYQAPTCFDGKQNQGETGIDLGGPCQALNSEELQPEVVMWARAFKVRSGEYAAIAYIQNPNRNAAAVKVPYHFSFYDSSNVIVAERSGVVTIMPGGITPVYEGQLMTGNRNISRTFFEFTDSVHWLRAGNPTAALMTGDVKTNITTTAASVSANIRNTDITKRDNVTVIAVAFDNLGNAFAASRTFIESLAGDESRRIVFTWPEGFPEPPVRTDIIPVMMPELEE